MIGAFAKLNFWVITEGYVIVIVASIPLMNSLVKWGKQTVSHNHKSSNSNRVITVKKTWVVEHKDAAYGEELNSQEAEQCVVCINV
jgi:hypothetical protein